MSKNTKKELDLNEIKVNREYIYKYIRLFSLIVFSLLTFIFSFYSVESALTKAKMKSVSMDIYKDIIYEKDNYNKLDLLKYLQTLDNDNKAIQEHITRVNKSIKEDEKKIEEKNRTIIDLEEKLRIEKNNRVNNDKIREYEEKIKNLTSEKDIISEKLEMKSYSQKYITQLINQLSNEIESISMDKNTKYLIMQKIIEFQSRTFKESIKGSSNTKEIYDILK